MSVEKGVTGVTFPILKWHMKAFFEGGKTVFIKPATVWKKLQPGMKFVFYQSREDTGYVGEAKIKNVILSPKPWELYNSYKGKVFLDEKEFKDYIGFTEKWKRSKKKQEKKERNWMAIELEDIQEYSEPVKPKRFVPVGGQYLGE